MRRRRRTAGTPYSRPSSDRWFVSYADFVTLLFAFFVVLFACAHTNQVKIVQAAPQPKAVPELQPTLRQLREQLRVEIDSGQMRLQLEPRGLVITLSQAAFFPSGADEIDQTLLPSIRKVAVAVRALPNSIRLEGHTDSDPIRRKPFRDNWDLSSARALAMLRVLNSSGEFDHSRFAVAGYADAKPVVSNDTEAGRAQNRRVDIVILSRAG